MAKNTCPYCGKEISWLEDWRANKPIERFFGVVRPFACPHCNKEVTWPEWAVRCGVFGPYFAILGMIFWVLGIRYVYIIRPLFWLAIVLLTLGLFGLKIKKSEHV